MIERQNILELIGKNKSKYSSCIITSYTFDYTFFEERIMSILRTSNIKNVNVFLDGKYLDQYHEDSDGHGFKTHKTYSYNKIYESGVFHPKLMLLTGPKNGLLIIGSGNLTSSGLSTNDEIWGAFHLNSIDSPNAPLFATVWNYLQQYFIQAKGFNAQKLGWVTQRSPWLNDIKGLSTNGYISLNGELELKFIGNTKVISSYQELITTLPNKKINKLTIISPYFDEQGKALEQFVADFKIGEIECITDSDFGLLPIRLSEQLYESVKFYDWKDCLKDFDKRFNRLHAKVFHFEFEDGWEYILLGSANASISALGSKTVKAINAEAGILLRRKMQKGFMNDFGINLKKVKPIDVKSFNRNKNVIGDSIPSIKFESRIIYTEINGSKMSIFLKDELNKECELAIFNSSGTEIEKQFIVAKSKEISISIGYANDAYKISLNDNGKRISNYSLIHNVALQSKCNPDPNHAEIGQIIEALSNDPENGQLIQLLSYADYNWVDEELDGSGKKVGRFSSRKNEIDTQKVYDTISEEEFYNLKSKQSVESDLLNNPSVQIEDFLNILSRGLVKPISSFKESEEEALSNQIDEERNGTGEEITQTISNNFKGGQEKKAIYKHLNIVLQFYNEQLEKIFNDKILQVSPNRPLILKDLSNMSIAIHLIHIFYCKKYSLARTEFILNIDKINFVNRIINYINNNSFEDAKIKISKVSSNYSSISKESSKEGLIKYIKANSKDLLINYIRTLEKTYGLIKLKKTNKENIDWSFCEVDSSLFSKLQNELIGLDPKLLVDQSEHFINTYFEYYIDEGLYNSL